MFSFQVRVASVKTPPTIPRCREFVGEEEALSLVGRGDRIELPGGVDLGERMLSRALRE